MAKRKTAKKHARKRSDKKTMFGPPKHRKLADIVTIKNPTAARRAAAKLIEMYEKAKTRKQKLIIKKATVLAANRAEAQRRRKDLSAKERKEMLEVELIYRRAAKMMR